MHLSRYISFSLSLLLAGYNAQATAITSRVASNNNPSITQPVAGTTITAGQPFDFNYVVSDACFEAYSPFAVWLLESQPTGLTPSGALENPDILFSFGNFTTPNFGAPPLQGAPPPPPPTLMAPTLTGADGAQVYLTIVETIFGCPPNGRTEFALTSTPVIYTCST